MSAAASAFLIYWTQFADFWGAERYSQHSICLTNDPLMIILYIASDLTIGAAYLSIGLSLITKRHLIAELNAAAILLYGTFIVLCSITHFSDVLLLYSGVYRLDILIRVATAMVSAITAFYTVVGLWLDRDAT